MVMKMLKLWWYRMYRKSCFIECYSCVLIKIDGDFIKFNIFFYLSLVWWIFIGFWL